MNNIINTHLIEEFRIKNGLSKRKFCQLCHISESNYKTIIKGSLNFNPLYLFRIARFMKIEIKHLFNE